MLDICETSIELKIFLLRCTSDYIRMPIHRLQQQQENPQKVLRKKKKKKHHKSMNYQIPYYGIMSKHSVLKVGKKMAHVLLKVFQFFAL